jgi:hypothetical protein
MRGGSACSVIGVYADDCFVDRVMKHKIYVVATLRGCQMPQRSEASVGHE